MNIQTIQLITIATTLVCILVTGLSTADAQLADQIEDHVNLAVADVLLPWTPVSVMDYGQLAVPGTWNEIWPSGTQTVSSTVWNAPIQAALDACGSVYLPDRGEPYYIDNPIVLKSGQRFSADPLAEIRLVPNANTCMIRNENLVGGSTGPVSSTAEFDSDILIEGGIWTTLATSPSQYNGNINGQSSRFNPVPSCHGVVLVNNVHGVVIRDITVKESKPHGIQVSNSSDFFIQDIVFDDHRRDGVHVHGSSDYGVIRNISGNTYDDFVALNAWDWQNTAPCFGSIDHVLVDGVYGNGTSTMRLLPGTKTFSDGTKLDCPVADCVIRDLNGIGNIKIYDQPNLEMGRDNDYCDPVGTVRNVSFSDITLNSPGLFQIATNVNQLSIDDVRLNFDIDDPAYSGYKLAEIGPMSQTYKFNPADPNTWVELFSPDSHIVVRDFELTNVRSDVGSTMSLVPNVMNRLVQVSDQEINPDYPNTTPRGGTGTVTMVNGREPILFTTQHSMAPLVTIPMDAADWMIGNDPTGQTFDTNRKAGGTAITAYEPGGSSPYNDATYPSWAYNDGTSPASSSGQRSVLFYNDWLGVDKPTITIEVGRSMGEVRIWGIGANGSTITAAFSDTSETVTNSFTNSGDGVFGLWTVEFISMQPQELTFTLNPAGYGAGFMGVCLMEEILVLGDANMDGKVDIEDAAKLAANWKTQVNATWAMGDFNADGKVDDSDATLLAANWHSGADDANATVPEPSTVLLWVPCLVCLIEYRKRSSHA